MIIEIIEIIGIMIEMIYTIVCPIVQTVIGGCYKYIMVTDLESLAACVHVCYCIYVYMAAAEVIHY